MSAIEDRIAAHRSWGDGFCECGFEFGEDARKWAGHLAAELPSWDWLMDCLDRAYPEDIFPTLEDREDRDTGPRIVSLLRQINTLRAEEKP